MFLLSVYTTSGNSPPQISRCRYPPPPLSQCHIKIRCGYNEWVIVGVARNGSVGGCGCNEWDGWPRVMVGVAKVMGVLVGVATMG
jgi:hypothetical protein